MAIETDAPRTHEMTVDDMTFLVDRLHSDCGRGQFVRELTKNSVQAAEDVLNGGMANKATVAWDFIEKNGVKKLCITDTGIGMTGAEMVSHINRLSASGRAQGHSFNYGVGAKISALPLNKMGLVYLSKKEGEEDGALVHLWFDPNTRRYGIMQQAVGGKYSSWARIPASRLPKPIKKHGTQVMLLGNAMEEDTTEQPEGLTGKKRWLFKYLYSRFFRIPASIELRVDVERQPGGREDPRRIYGLEHWLRDSAVKRGTVILTGAVAHWFILKDGTDSSSGLYPNFGMVAALWQDELYDMMSGANANPRLIAFGVMFETKRVVIIVEPDAKKYPTLTSDTARTRLLIDGGPLHWSDWAREFRENLPTELEELQEEAAGKASSGDVRKNIVERLKLNLDLFRLSRYRRSAKGTLRADPSSLDDGSGAVPGDDDDTPTVVDSEGQGSGGGGGGGGGGRRGGGQAERASEFYAGLLDDADAQGVMAEQAEVNEKIPEVKFLTIENNTRQVGDLEDRAARYSPQQNLLQINLDFRVFKDMRERWEKAYKGNDTAKAYIAERVKEWFSQQLIEAVMTGKALAGTSQYWTDEDVERYLWSEEALTATILPRYHIDMKVKREVASKFGKAGEALEVE